jgi:hypothetical protein
MPNFGTLIALSGSTFRRTTRAACGKCLTTGTSHNPQLTTAANWGNLFGGAAPSASPASAPAAPAPAQPTPDLASYRTSEDPREVAQGFWQGKLLSVGAPAAALPMLGGQQDQQQGPQGLQVRSKGHRNSTLGGSSYRTSNLPVGRPRRQPKRAAAILCVQSVRRSSWKESS